MVCWAGSALQIRCYTGNTLSKLFDTVPYWKSINSECDRKDTWTATNLGTLAFRHSSPWIRSASPSLVLMPWKKRGSAPRLEKGDWRGIEGGRVGGGDSPVFSAQVNKLGAFSIHWATKRCQFSLLILLSLEYPFYLRL